MIPYSGPCAFASLTRVLNRGPLWSTSTSLGWRSGWHLPWLGWCSNCLNVTDCDSHDCRGYLCVFNFITPMPFTCLSGYQPAWPAYTHASLVLLVKQLEHPVPEIPHWQFCQRSICNKRILSLCKHIFFFNPRKVSELFLENLHDKRDVQRSLSII